jgi:hypothetical protein
VIRGSIEVIAADRVAGWIFCAAESLKGQTVLAFCGQRCIGSGEVERYRKDLAEAGLGDGYCGFDFTINLRDSEKLGSVVIKLQGSDAMLVSGESYVASHNDKSDATDLGPIPAGGLAFLQDRGWLAQGEYDFLKAIQNLGAYELSLRTPRRSGEETSEILPAGQVAADMIGVFNLSETNLVAHEIDAVTDLISPKSALREAACPVVALWSQTRGRVFVLEKSHLGPASNRAMVLTEPVSGAIDYNFGPDRVLFLHRDVVFGPRGTAPETGISLFTADKQAETAGVAPVALAADRGAVKKTRVTAAA